MHSVATWISTGTPPRCRLCRPTATPSTEVPAPVSWRSPRLRLRSPWPRCGYWTGGPARVHPGDDLPAQPGLARCLAARLLHARGPSGAAFVFEADAPCAVALSGRSLPHGYRQRPARGRCTEPAATLGHGADGWSCVFGEGATGVSISALCAAMQGLQQPVWRPRGAPSRRCRIQPVAQEPEPVQSLL